MKVNITELADKYYLPENVVIEVIEDAISDFLKAELFMDVDCVYSEDTKEFKIYGFDETRGSRYEVSPAKLEHVSFQRMLEVIQSRLIHKSLEADFDYYYKLMGNLIVGKVIKRTKNGDYIVEYEDSASGNNVYCLYPVSQQPPAESDCYEIGQKYIFYVLRVFIDFDNEVPTLKIILSRKSKSLVELLIKQELINRGYYDVDVVVAKRIANAFSGVIVNKKIPNEVIKKISSYLQERIIVRYFVKMPPKELIESNKFWKMSNGKVVKKINSELRKQSVTGTYKGE